MPERIVNFDDIADKGKVLTYFRNLRGKHRVSVVRYRRRRSDQQNAYMWGVVLPYVAAGFQEAWGESLTSEEVHEFLKKAFLPTRTIVDKRTGEEVAIPATTTRLSTVEFMEYIERIAKFSAERLGVAIPLPNEITSDKARARVGA
jgi:hypothetical protein